MKTLQHLMSLLLPLFLLLSCSISQTNLQKHCLDEQRSTLLELQQGLYYVPNSTFSSKVEFWDPNTDCCSWKGLTCDALGYVIGLDLSYKNLSGSFHSIFDLRHLRRLNLAGNMLNTTLVQYRFDRLPNLTHLNLSGSCFHVRIPVGILSLPTMQSVDVSHNKDLIGQLPEFPSNSSLQILSLSFTSFKGRLPESIGHLKSLKVLALESCDFSGSIPSSIANLTNLVVLNLAFNEFSGEIPEFAEATQLSFLQLNGNKLEGKLPRSLVNCTRLKVLDLGSNGLYDIFPSWLGKLPAMMVLSLPDNRFYVPIKLSENDFPALDVLDMCFNDFSGQLMIKFFQASNMRSLKFGGNNLEGKLPRSLANLTKLEVLELGKNMIHDTFPFWLSELPSLRVLVLRENGFYGPTEISGDRIAFPMLRILDLASNNFSGELSAGFLHSLTAKKMMTDDNYVKLHYIGEGYYNDSVTIVNKGIEIYYQKFLTTLVCLDLSNNSFQGRIPEEIQNLKSLKVLNLSFNSFFGPIPSALGSLTELESLDLSENEFFGRIPLQLTSLTFLAVLNLSYNQLEGSIPQSNQFGTYSNDSYKGNPEPCGLPLTKKCDEVGPRTLPLEQDAGSWLDDCLGKKIMLFGYGCGLVIGFCLGYTVLNEWTNKWSNNFVRIVIQSHLRKRSVF